MSTLRGAFHSFVIQKSELFCVKWFDLDDVIEFLKNKDDRFVISDKIYDELVKLKKILG